MWTGLCVIHCSLPYSAQCYFQRSHSFSALIPGGYLYRVGPQNALVESVTAFLHNEGKAMDKTVHPFLPGMFLSQDLAVQQQKWTHLSIWKNYITNSSTEDKGWEEWTEKERLSSIKRWVLRDELCALEGCWSHANQGCLWRSWRCNQVQMRPPLN